MSSGTKVALVALMVLLMVVIARLVNDESDSAAPGKTAGVGVANAPGGESDGGGTNKDLAQKPPAMRSPSGQTTPKSRAAVESRSIQRSANPSMRSTPPRTPGARAGSPGESSSRGSPTADDVRLQTSPGAHVARSRTIPPTTSHGSPSDPSALRRLAEGAGPISGAPGAEEPPTAGEQVGGLTSDRSSTPPVSIQGRSATRTGDTAQNPVVDTRLGTRSGTTPRPEEGPGAGLADASGSSLGSSRSITSPDPLGHASGGSATGNVPLKSYGDSRTSPAPAPSRATTSETTSFPATYTIEPNDSLWKIAEKYYGRGYLYKQIEVRNPGVKVQPGKTLIIPAPAPDSSERATTTLRSANTPPRTTRSSQETTHVVQKGETLWEIAGRAYGDPTLWVRIKDANPDLRSGDQIKVGMTIRIPQVR